MSASWFPLSEMSAVGNGLHKSRSITPRGIRAAVDIVAKRHGRRRGDRSRVQVADDLIGQAIKEIRWAVNVANNIKPFRFEHAGLSEPGGRCWF